MSSTHIIYQRTKQIKQENKDIVVKKCIQDDNGLLAFNEEDKKKACKQHCARLLNVKFPWREEDLSTADPLLGPPLLITQEIVAKSICKVQNRKASGLSGFFLNCDSLHAGLNSQYKTCSYKKKKQKKNTAYRKSLQKEPTVKRCLLILDLHPLRSQVKGKHLQAENSRVQLCKERNC